MCGIEGFIKEISQFGVAGENRSQPRPAPYKLPFDLGSR